MRLLPLFVAAAALTLSACESTTAVKSQDKQASVEQNKEIAVSSINIFEIHHNGRINVFYDKKTSEAFTKLGETSYRLTRIGAGPNGETVVFGLTKEDKKKGVKTPAVMMWDGLAKFNNFYGEMHKNNRIYVFSDKKQMDKVRQLGHPAYMFTEIGAGPKGETVVYVLNQDNKKKKPVEMIKKYKQINS